jgi:hypothetical protein
MRACGWEFLSGKTASAGQFGGVNIRKRSFMNVDTSSALRQLRHIHRDPPRLIFARGRPVVCRAAHYSFKAVLLYNQRPQ